VTEYFGRFLYLFISFTPFKTGILNILRHFRTEYEHFRTKIPRKPFISPKLEVFFSDLICIRFHLHYNIRNQA
jgi:hypothetical protein